MNSRMHRRTKKEGSLGEGVTTRHQTRRLNEPSEAGIKRERGNSKDRRDLSDKRNSCSDLCLRVDASVDIGRSRCRMGL